MTDGKIRSLKNTRTRLAGRYLAALRAHLVKKNRVNGDSAQGLGRAVLDAGLVTLDLAVMHEQAVIALAPTHNFSNTRNGLLQRKGYFLTQALVPLEAAQRATRVAVSNLHQRNVVLLEHSKALARGNLRLRTEITRRKAGEVVITQSKEQYRKLFLESQVMQRRLRKLTHEIISAQEDERKEISRDLHDHVVQTLVGITVELAALSQSASVGLHTLREKIARTQRLVENSVNAVHRFARELRPAVLDDLGLIPALLAYSKNVAERKKLKIHLTAFGGVEALDGAKRTVLFRVAQEALNNVARHARASRVTVTIRKIPGGIRMEVSDNGQSFPVEKILGARNPKRLGLVGMRERVEMVGGHLNIISKPGEGTVVRAEIPFKSEKTNK